MTNQLRIYRDMAALEHAASSSSLGELVQSIFPSIVSELTGFINRFNPLEKGIHLTHFSHTFMREIVKHNYMDITALMAYKPEGLSVPYLDYTEALLPSVDHSSQIINKVLGPYSTLLSQLITNPENQLSAHNQLTTMFSKYESDRSEMNNIIGKCFDKGSTQSETTYGNVVARNADWQKVFVNIDNMLKKINFVDRKALNKKVNECDELLHLLVEKIKKDQYKDISSEMVMNLSNGAYCVASELEMYSITYYRVLALSETVNHTVENVNRLLNK